LPGSLEAVAVDVNGVVLEPTKVASFAKGIVEDAIAADKRLSGAGIPHCGGHAEVVIVDSDGARFVYKAPTSGSP
jgi:hypothetical protein